ncbi:hypothetical protein ciss_17570 [Carboxydothermus islandicus]|uniref:Uncharacterized protein n=1 Tax=Carboxydothermus islandicus TaxID=661089 RepID=A0A1L8D3Z2_9THEO|nr:hypothetical protein ciss_17570 [Carboxydothermus islandicus]
MWHYKGRDGSENDHFKEKKQGKWWLTEPSLQLTVDEAGEALGAGPYAVASIADGEESFIVFGVAAEVAEDFFYFPVGFDLFHRFVGEGHRFPLFNG